MNYKVSVIIPTYKRELRYLSRAIDSILKQTYKDCEIVVVDDNPPESKFRKAVSEFMQQYDDSNNVSYVQNKKNVGGSIARNNGIFAATGEYITFLDDDDEYLPEKIEKQLNYMIVNACDMSLTDLKFMNEKKEVVDYRKYNIPSFDKESLLKYHIMRHLTGTPTFMYKTDKIREIGGFEDAKMGQEFYLMLKSIERGLKIGYLNDCDLIAYRHKDGGISFGKNKIDGEKALFNFKKNYFHLFSIQERMFIRFRHYAVLVIAYKRNKKYTRMMASGIAMLMVSPFDFFKETTKFLVNIYKYRKGRTN